MTRAEATKQANSIIDYFVKLCGFERRRDIRLYVNEDDWQDRDYDGATQETLTHGIYDIVLIITPNTPKAEFINTVCHELAHIFTAEYKFFYSVFVSDPEDGENTISRQVFSRYHEDVAKRLAVIFTELWNLKGGKTK
jgi:hypothetical protein